MIECLESKHCLGLIKISPSEQLDCIGQLKSTRKCNISISNPTNQTITYKIKATSPDHIKLRPGYGYLKPNTVTQLQMTVMPMKDRNRPPQHEHISIMLAEVASNFFPKNPQNLWCKAYPKDIRKDHIKIKFVVGVAVNGNEKTHEVEESDEEETGDDEVDSINGIVKYLHNTK